jgi:hypothetical protein
MSSFARRSKGTILAALLITVPLVLLIAPSPPAADGLSLLSIQRTGSGLVTSDPLTTGNTSLWTFGGVAVDAGAPHQSYEDGAGLHLGVQSLTAGQYYGYFAARGEDAQLFHAILSLPSSTISASEIFNTGLYVQTGGSDVDYVTCAGEVDNGGYAWAVVQTTGTPSGSTTFNTLWYEWMGGQPLTRDCTIITNGSNFLEVYLDGSLVYSSNSLNLGYQFPLTAFLEVESTDNTSMHFSTYTDYYATASGSIQVTGAPIGSTVKVVGPSGTVLASGQAGLSGSTVLDISRYDMPLVANIEVVLGGLPLASTLSPVHIYGGDTYAVSAGPGSPGGVPIGPMTINPALNDVINTNVGQGITVNLGDPSSSSPPVCLFGICV